MSDVRKGQLTKFIYDFQQREATQQIFRLLEYMVPVHVIVPMLRNPGAVIADEVGLGTRNVKGN